MPRALLPAAIAALALSASASAHVVPQPQFLSTGDTATLTLAGPNERDEPMTGLSVTVPVGLRIVDARGANGWIATADGRTAIWTGGRLESMIEATFELRLEVSADPGTVTLETTQLYPDGETVSWPVSLTILPGTESQSQNLGWALAAAIAGLVVTVGVVLVAWRRRMRSLQER